MDPITQKLVPGAAGFIPNHYVDEVFSVDTWFGNGNGTSSPYTPSNKKITNGINMEEHGGMVWSIQRGNLSGAQGYDCYKAISDTDIGVQKRFWPTSGNSALGPQSDAMQSFDSDGWTMGSNVFMNEGVNDNSDSSQNVAYTFRKQPGFFDMVTFTTGDGSNKQPNRRINHSLECKPGFIIVKNQTNTGNYYVYHKVQGRSQYSQINQAGSFGGDTNFWGSDDPTKTDFGINETAPWWVANSTYSVWMWADGDDPDAKIFGLGKDSEIVKVVKNTGQNNLINLGWEPQAILVLADGSNCFWFDYLRGWSSATESGMFTPYHGVGSTLNTTNEESNGYEIGANVNGWWNGFFSGEQYCLAIRRPDAKVGKWAKTPNECIHLHKAGEPSTERFFLNTFLDGSNNPTGFGVQDMEFSMRRYNNSCVWMNTNRMMSGSSSNQGGTGSGVTDYGFSRWYLKMDEGNYLANTPEASLRNIRYDLNTPHFGDPHGPPYIRGSYIPANGWGNNSNGAGQNAVFYMFKRKPGFFDMVKYVGGGSFVNPNLTNTPHALGVKPDLVIAKSIGNNNGYGSYGNWWGVWSRAAGDAGVHDKTYNTTWINHTIIGTRYQMWGDIDGPGAETMDIRAGLFNAGGMGGQFMYLFANCEGVFHTGIYTGAGEGTPVDVTEVGFSPRILMLKNISTTGCWWVWDTARGFSSSNDPYLWWNGALAEVGGTDYVDPLSNGFQITNTAPGDSSLKLNVSGEKVLYLAFA